MRRDLELEEIKKLMERARDGDKEAFSIIYQNYFNPVFRYIFLRVGDRNEVEDLTQTVFLKVYRGISNYQDLNLNPLAYFFTVARNTIIDYFRKKKEVLFKDREGEVLEVPDTKSSHEDLMIRKEERILVREMIKDLNQKQQEVIILKFIEEMENDKIAQILNKNEAAIRQIQSRAIKILRKKLKNLI